MNNRDIILARLKDGPATTADIKPLVNIKSCAVARTIGTMISQGIVHRVDDGGPGRRATYALRPEPPQRPSSRAGVDWRALEQRYVDLRKTGKTSAEVALSLSLTSSATFRFERYFSTQTYANGKDSSCPKFARDHEYVERLKAAGGFKDYALIGRKPDGSFGVVLVQRAAA